MMLSWFLLVDSALLLIIGLGTLLRVMRPTDQVVIEEEVPINQWDDLLYESTFIPKHQQIVSIQRLCSGGGRWKVVITTEEKHGKH